MKRIYFAHPVWTYDTEVEAAIVRDLERLGYEVVNPNSSEHQAAYAEHGMAHFTVLAASCEALAYLSETDENWGIDYPGNHDVGAGVAREILEMLVLGKPVYILSRGVHAEHWRVDCTGNRIPGVLTIEETRARRAEKLAERDAA